MHLPGLDNDYSDDYLKGGGGGGATSGNIGPQRAGGASPGPNFGAQKSSIKIHNGNAIINGSGSTIAGIP